MGGGGRTSSGSSGRPGGAGNVGQTNSAPAKTTDYGSPIHTSTGPVYGGIQATQDPAHWQATVNRVGDYNKAAEAWNKSAQQPSLSNLLNSYAPMGLSMQAPNLNRPVTFAGGDYHLGWNPGSLLGLAGGTIPGASIPLGAMGQGLYTAMGGQNPILGGPGAPANQPNWGNGATAALPGDNVQGGQAPSTQNMAQGHAQSGTQQLTNLAQLNSNVSGNPSAPQAVGTPQTAGQSAPNYQQIMASIRGVTPNYGVSLPQYQYRGRATV